MPETAANELYLDDVSVGLEFRSAEHRLDAQQIISFASEFDPQPFHLDEVAARNTFFQGLAASGWHTMAITMRLLVQSLPFAHGVIGASAEVSWPAPTRPGDILHVRGKVLDIKPSRSKPDRGIVLAQCLTVNQHEELRQEFKPRLLVFRRATSEGGAP